MFDRAQTWQREHDDAEVALVDALSWHADFIRAGGSPVAALITEAVRDDVRAGGPLASVLPESVRFGDLVSLRVMAAVHRLAIERLAPRVALHLPTLGGSPPTSELAREDFRAAIVDALVAHEDLLLASLAHTPQTNETGRSALLRCALSRLGTSRPVRLREIGASAGLNLRADHLPGNPDLEVGPLPPILDRVGCDLHPIDPTTTEGRVTLSSYIWVDDVDRFERLRRALVVAEQVPATLVTADAVDFVESLELVDCATTLLWQSAFWTYLRDSVRSRITTAIEHLGSQATAERPFAYASWEFSGDVADHRPEFFLSFTTWQGDVSDGQVALLASGDSHGTSSALIRD